MVHIKKNLKKKKAIRDLRAEVLEWCFANCRVTRELRKSTGPQDLHPRDCDPHKFIARQDSEPADVW